MWLREANSRASAADAPLDADWLRRTFKFPPAI